MKRLLSLHKENYPTVEITRELSSLGNTNNFSYLKVVSLRFDFLESEGKSKYDWDERCWSYLVLTTCSDLGHVTE